MADFTGIFMIQLLLFLLAAGIGRIISKKTGQPIVLGELLMGMFLANICLLIPIDILLGMPDIFTVSETISEFANIGILLLLFSAGLEMDFHELKRVGKASFSAALLGAFLPLFAGFILALFLLPLVPELLLEGVSIYYTAAFFGLCLVATSVGVTAGVLRELKLLRSRIGTLILGAAIIDDVLGILFMSILISIIATGEISLVSIGSTVGIILLFFLLSLTIGVKIIKKASETFWLNQENLLFLGLLIAFAFGVFSEGIGLAAITGAFLAGVIIGQSRYARSLMNPLYVFGESFFIPIFFLT